MSWVNVGMAAVGAVKGISGAKANKKKQKQHDAFRKASIAMSPWSGLGDPGAVNAGNSDPLSGAVGGGMQGLMLAQAGTKAFGAMGGAKEAAGAAGGLTKAGGGSAGALGGGAPMMPTPQAPPMLQSNAMYAANNPAAPPQGMMAGITQGTPLNAGYGAPQALPPSMGGNPNEMMAAIQQGTPMDPGFAPPGINQQVQNMGMKDPFGNVAFNMKRGGGY